MSNLVWSLWSKISIAQSITIQRLQPAGQPFIRGDAYMHYQRITYPYAGWIAVTTLSLAATGAALAFDQAKLDVFNTTNACRYCDLSGALLNGRDLRGADLEYANLSGVDIGKADLSARQMEKRVLPSNLVAVNFRKADLSGANLTNANLARAHLREANLSGANLTESDLSGANLRDADLSGANLSGAKTQGAKLEGAKFCNTTMPDGSVNDANC